MANINYNPKIKKGKEKLCSCVRGKKLKVTLDTFVEIFEIPREDNPECEFLDVGMLDLAMVSQELLLEGDEWDVSMNTARARLLWAIGMGKTIDLPCMMFLSLCAAHMASDKSGSVNARMTSLEEESRRHTTMLQKMKGMMIRMEAEYDDDDDDEEEEEEEEGLRV
ncbi:hypothetical protein Acr_00g0032140 [Actinidia rufa]|uniref:Uncharacterized protein n=1 Tax=Actinidia rufa TaxID=165716 RepID=A0A7J0DFC1_9ERIC|nr:hypothetical protein Acr_00g0032140 [Actinidia rufa]